MKTFMKCLLAVITGLLLLALYDSFYNGLFNADGYKPVTEQMNELRSD